MAKHTLTHKKLIADSGEQSGIYLFTDGLLVFAPIRKETVVHFMKQALADGPNTMVSHIEKMLGSAVAAHPGADPKTSADDTDGAQARWTAQQD